MLMVEIVGGNTMCPREVVRPTTNTYSALQPNAALSFLRTTVFGGFLLLLQYCPGSLGAVRELDISREFTGALVGRNTSARPIR